MEEENNAIEFEVPIDPEFENLIPPPTEQEFAGLEAAILRDGCTDPLIVWKGHGTLIDGHNRKKICDKYNVPYKTNELSFDSREDVKRWIIEQKLKRQGLTEYARFELVLKLDQVEKENMENIFRESATRHKSLLERQKAWRLSSPAHDIDFLLFVFNGEETKGIVKYKRTALSEWRRNHSSSVISELGTMAGVPAFVCGYAENFSWFWPIPLNEEAYKWIPERDGRRLAEKEWVEMLYAMRGRTMPVDLPVAGIGADDNRR